MKKNINNSTSRLLGLTTYTCTINKHMLNVKYLLFSSRGDYDITVWVMSRGCFSQIFFSKFILFCFLLRFSCRLNQQQKTHPAASNIPKTCGFWKKFLLFYSCFTVPQVGIWFFCFIFRFCLLFSTIFIFYFFPFYSFYSSSTIIHPHSL